MVLSFLLEAVHYQVLFKESMKSCQVRNFYLCNLSAYNTAGIYIPYGNSFFKFGGGFKEQYEINNHTIYEIGTSFLLIDFLGKFLALLEQGNPNIIWSLYQPSWFEIDELKDLRKHRQKFVTARAIHQV